jgi:RNA polymerase sigma-70 factor (ECF subfamily)
MTACPTQVLQSDSELIAAVRAGDTGLYAVLVRRYERLVRATALQKLGDRHLAEDVAQDAFLIAFESLASLRNEDLFGGWLLGIARNRALHVCRSSARREISWADLDALPGAHATGLSADSLDLLELVDRLPEHERVLVGLKHFEAHTAAEIATIMGRPIGTVTKQLSRAYARLGQWLSQETKR